MKTPKQYLIDQIEKCSENELDQYLNDLSEAIYERINNLKEKQLYITNEINGENIENDEWHDYEQQIIRLDEIDQTLDIVLTENGIIKRVNYGL